ncbi:UBP-type zinc finger domain-containing protein [Streptomyces venezuelae]|uniref:UBP-type zinc finger domain-containing protein n=1 Tax=Streptomyces venezuelae TaxID=54571 RepID=UPI00278BDFFF|nr:UBP-type zinc finger domain-containing protein [Streptomyces venezuelae]
MHNSQTPAQSALKSGGGAVGSARNARNGLDRADSVQVPAAGWQVAPDGGRARPRPCRHLDTERPIRERLPVTGCAECLAADREDWINLRVCLRCGHNGCCDSSPGAHAHQHASETDHPIAAAAEQPWAWCYTDEVFLVPASAPETAERDAG